MVDVIVPIYNAYDYVEKCINSIIKSSDLSKDRLILIDDKSPDSRIYGLLINFKEKYPDLNIVVLQNETNLGFVGTVNRGMKYSENDVILLNSDTEVTNQWIEKMNNCAYSSLDVASVTALSNNATLASVPKGLQPNDIPNGWSLDDYASMIYKTSYHDYPEIPTAHGFCMYIKRSVLNHVGFFDEETFGKGYGEENDFSYRCMEYGYKHLLCDDTYVFHKESQSFSEKKQELIDTNLKILKKRYPVCFNNTDNWCSDFPINYICKNVFYNTYLGNKENILFVIHDWSNVKNNVGGTTIHCLDLINGLKDKYNFHVFTPESGIYKLYSYFGSEESVLEFDNVSYSGIKSFYNKKYANILKQIILSFGIKFVHIHHMLDHYFDIVDVCKKTNVKVGITLHDFYCLCPTINLLYQDQYCLPLQHKDCLACLKEKKNLSNNIIPVWREQWIMFLKKMDYVLTPSKSTKDIIEGQLGDLHCLVQEHGVFISKNVAKKLDENVQEFNVAFVGFMAKHKGRDIAKYLISNCNSKKIKFHLFGDSDIDVLKKNKNNFIYHGRYKRDELNNLLSKNNIHLVCNLSIWPETYSYTLTETIACGVPVLSYNIGAVGERIEKYGFGWTLSNQDRKQTLQTIIDISENISGYNEVIDKLNSYQIKTMEEMLEFYDSLYQNGNDKEYSLENLHALLKLDQKDKVVGLDIKTKQMLNSKRWKLVQKIKLPEFVWSMARKVVK
ncbi:glycosyltransferase [Faecalitalea cylindroides]|uniref:glycosyltransferase n=1 Tax=Faecalitalea cylindroides TaxID=39483 RepID=UPI003992EEAD